jgi:glycosyltransferase involved in cell wall biosynthesis
MPTLSIVVPVHNEARYLRAILDRVLAVAWPLEHELIAVDDGSDDESRAILEEYTQRSGVRVTRHTRRRGKGAAVRTGIEVSTGDFIVVQDADLEYDPADIPPLLDPLIEGRADVVYGSRFRRESPQVHRTAHYLGNRLLTALSNMLSGIYLSDMETCYKVFRADLLKAMHLRSNRFGFEVETTAYIAKVHARVFELPVTYFPRTRAAGKKIGWRDGVAALVHLVQFNLLTSRAVAFREVPKRYRDS